MDTNSWGQDRQRGLKRFCDNLRKTDKSIFLLPHLESIATGLLSMTTQFAENVLTICLETLITVMNVILLVNEESTSQLVHSSNVVPLVNAWFLEHGAEREIIHKMMCNSKISSLSWSQYHKGMLVSSDYEGTVTIWDALTGTQTQLLQEHEKRCWSVDFNVVDPNLIASSSDDTKVKLWSINMENSVATLEAKANVCCVKFNPSSRYNIAFGSADHCVHYYDLRNPKRSLAVFKGHRKAVSYAKFVDSCHIVSACTFTYTTVFEELLRSYLKSYYGDYIACGSANNALYVYYKCVSRQLLTFEFDAVRNLLDSNVVVAANSQGQIKSLKNEELEVMLQMFRLAK